MSMNILGIKYVMTPGGHEPSAALVRDGKLLAAVEEERFVRDKHAISKAPYFSIRYCLEKGGIKINDIDIIAFSFSPSHGLKRLFKNPFKLVKNKEKLFRFKAMDAGIKHLKRKFGYRNKIVYIEHHIAHAASAYFCSGFNKASILSIDGMGEHTSTLCGYGDKNGITILKEFDEPHSLGLFYEAFTELCGFDFLGAGKTMGLAPYGKPKYNFNNLIDINQNGYEIKSDAIYDKRKLSKVLGIPINKGNPLKKPYPDIAASAQNILEKAANKLVDITVERTGCKNIVLAGGVALNCKMNGELLKKDNVKNIFVQPASHDAGAALGAALYTYFKETGKIPKFEMDHVYYGPEFGDEEIKDVLRASKMDYEYREDAAEFIGEKLAENKLAGWFQGRMEFGPRALGNRSILANPMDKTSKDKVNYYVKRRDHWRPFCPSLLSKDKKKYLQSPYKSPFMILSFDVPKEVAQKVPGITHVDNTTRPQTVEKTINPKYYNLIKSFKKETGESIVLNTSFNFKGEPIVCRPLEAVKDFYAMGLDYLAIGNYVLKKR